MEPIWIVLGIAFIVLLWFMGTYNGLVRLKNHCKEAWSGIDTELKRRHDLIPNLVDTVKGYAAHERETFETVIAARSAAMAASGKSETAQATAENNFVSGLQRLMFVSEGYPELKSDRNFLALQNELSNTEDRIQATRRFYNANVRDLNNRIDSFPSNILAGMFGFQRRSYFEIQDSSVRNVPKVDLGGNA